MIILSILTALASAQGLGCPSDAGTPATITNASSDLQLQVTIDAGPQFANATTIVHAAACITTMPGVSGMQLIQTAEYVRQCGGAHGLICPRGTGWPLAFPNYQYAELDSNGRATVAIPDAATFFPIDYVARAFVVDFVGNVATSTPPLRMVPVCPYENGNLNRCYFCGGCAEGEGNCIGNDGMCAPNQGLQCSKDVGADFGLAPTVDVCMNPTSPGFCSVPLGDADRCWYCGPCGAGEGACSHNLDCLGGFIGDMECAFEPSVGWNTCQIPTP